MKNLLHTVPLIVLLLLAGCTAQGQSPPSKSGSADPSDPFTSSFTDTAQAEQPTEISGAQNAPSSSGTGSSPGGSNGALSPQEPSENPSSQPTYPAPTGTPWVSETQAEKPEPVELDGLRFTSFGRYSGTFFEDGGSTQAEDVAVVLVVNTTDRFLELGTYYFDIDGVSAAFSVTNLPPQRGAWVLEQKALQIKSGAAFVLKGGTSTFCTPEEVPGVTAQPLDGTVLVTNASETGAFSGYIYYKAVYTDGNFLGGITYRAPVEELPARSVTEVTAGHCTQDCEIVRIIPSG